MEMRLYAHCAGFRRTISLVSKLAAMQNAATGEIKANTDVHMISSNSRRCREGSCLESMCVLRVFELVLQFRALADVLKVELVEVLEVRLVDVLGLLGQLFALVDVLEAKELGVLEGELLDVLTLVQQHCALVLVQVVGVAVVVIAVAAMMVVKEPPFMLPVSWLRALPVVPLHKQQAR
eukprot:6488167-Amphidinium_carterae.2